LDRLARLLQIERQSAPEQSFGIKVAEDEIGVGDGRLRAALPITSWPRGRPGTVGTDLQQAHAVDPADRAAAGAKRLDLDHRNADAISQHIDVLVDVGEAVAR